MFRAFFDLLLMVVVITLLRSVLGIISKAVSGQGNRQRPAERPSQAQVPLSGELKKDPVCGTYIATATSIKESVGGQTFHFCSKECRDKYVASLAR